MNHLSGQNEGCALFATAMYEARVKKMISGCLLNIKRQWDMAGEYPFSFNFLLFTPLCTIDTMSPSRPAIVVQDQQIL